MIGILFLDKKKSPPFSVGMIVSALTIKFHGLLLCRHYHSCRFFSCLPYLHEYVSAQESVDFQKKLMELFLALVDLDSFNIGMCVSAKVSRLCQDLSSLIVELKSN